MTPFEVNEEELPCVVCGVRTQHVSFAYDPPEPLCSVECERRSDEEYQHILEILKEADDIYFDKEDDDPGEIYRY